MIRTSRILLSALLSLTMSYPLCAQIAIGYNEFDLKNTLKAKFIDSDTNSPVPGVSLYLTLPGDSTIVALTFSDNDGLAVIEHVVSNVYDISAEMLGYSPVHLSRQINGLTDLGVIKMNIDARTIDPSSIEAYVKPMEIKKDTVIYHAAAFPVMENAVLEDLIRKMPGLSVDEKGGVYANGRSIEQITVGGRTFFFDDPSMVMKSLPARVVEKILIVDQQNRDSEFSGLVSSSSRAKVMDIQLKEEFMKSLFGRVSLGGGTTLHGHDSGKMTNPEKILYNTNTMVSYGTDDDQLTVIGIGSNDGVQKGGTAVGTNDMDEFDARNGLTSAVKTGANFNTLRIKGLESNASLSYYYDNKDVIDRTSTDIMHGDNLSTLSRRLFEGTGDNRMISGNVNIMNINTSKFSFKLTPTISYSKKNRAVLNLSDVGAESFPGDRSEYRVVSSTLSEGIRFSAGVKDIGGKRSRTLNFSGVFSHHTTDGDESRYISSSSEQLALLLDSRTGKTSFSGQVTYSEPLTSHWTIQGMLQASRQTYRKTVDAVDIDTHEANSYYSSLMDEGDAVVGGRVLMQYRKGPLYWTFGPIVEHSNKRLESVTYGKSGDSRETKTNWSPYMNLGWNDGTHTFSAEYDGRTVLPTSDMMHPSIDMANQVTRVIGNIYLLPSYVHSVFPSLTVYTDSDLMLFLSSGVIVTTKPSTIATWEDRNGAIYTMPVNAMKPQSSLDFSLDLSKTFGREKNWSVDMSASSSYASTSSYFAQDVLPSLDAAHLDYTSVMKYIWGGPSGEAFYGGISGFRENHVKESVNSASANLAYRNRSLSVRMGGSVNNTSYSYSQLSTRPVWWRFNIINSITWKNRLFQSDIDVKYLFYSGVESDFAKPELVVNAGISKDIKNISLTLKANDILNQHRSYVRNVRGNIMLDQYSNVIGRNLMVGISFHFGAPSRKSNSKASDAVQNITYY